MSGDRKSRCRMRDRFDNPCTGEVIDPDPEAIQICPQHALRGAQLLAEHGAIQIKTLTSTRRS